MLYLCTIILVRYLWLCCDAEIWYKGVYNLLNLKIIALYISRQGNMVYFKIHIKNGALTTLAPEKI